MNCRTTIAGLVIAVALAAATAVAAPIGRPQDAAWIAAFEANDLETAHDALSELLRREPLNPILVYNLACAEAMLGRADAAVETLIRAIEYGFVDFHHMERDGRLDPIRERGAYRRILDNWGVILDRRIDAELAALAITFDKRYRQARVARHRVAIVAALAESDLDAVRDEIARTAACLAELFGPEGEPDAARPDPWVLVIIPTPEDFVLMARSGTLAGYFERDSRRLVTRDIGPSLRHELVHALYWRRLDRLGQQRPIWIHEGLASLFEDLEPGPAASCVPSGSWRTNITRRLARGGSLTRWSRLFALDEVAFLDRHPQANYAQCRSVLRYLDDHDALSAWLGLLPLTSGEDPSGAEALARALDRPLAEIERDFRRWARDRPPVADAESAAPSLGVPLATGAGIGPAVDLGDDPVERFRAARDAGPLRHGDVIVAVEGAPTRTLNDLARILAGHAPGDTVVLSIRRGGRELDVRIDLIPAGGRPRSPR